MAIRKNYFLWIVIIAVLVVLFFVFSGDDKSSSTSEGVSVDTGKVGSSGSVEKNIDWMNVELKDVNTGETYRVRDFAGKPVLIESFAVWCPTCTRQQRETKELHDEVGDSIISIGLDTDPNENEQRVLTHVQQNGFDWRYSVSPVEMTQALINEFGPSIVNAPSVPMILVCEDGKARKLGSGIKSSEELKAEVARGC